MGADECDVLTATLGAAGTMVQMCPVCSQDGVGRWKAHRTSIFEASCFS